MSGDILPLPQYAFMAWCSVKAQGQLYLFTFTFTFYHFVISFSEFIEVKRMRNEVITVGDIPV
jgi:hypothetical protein